MRAVEIAAPGRLAPVERPLPEPTGTEVRVDVGYCGICGTDLHMRDSLPQGAVLGHELAGTVAAVGPDVDGWSVGDRAAVLIYRNCGECRYCRAGEENHCLVSGQHSKVIGVDLQGGYAEAVVADQALLYPLPDDLPLEHAALAEPVSIGVRAARTVDVPFDDPVLVIGAGPIGLLAAYALRARGYQRLWIVERNPGRAAAAERLGFHTLPSDDLAGELQRRGIEAPGAIVECAAAPAAAKAAVGLLRRQGRLVLVGLPDGDVSFDAQTLVINEIQVRGAAGTSHQDFRTAIDLLASGAVPAADLITAVADLDDADTMFGELLDPATEHVKVLLRP
ncbi:MAG: alcohol dehydrogenase catalytic domain-containing protein [Solirubrobacterales bacterium]|nr:alcohol dehydrogenase catalytic domain-containing protein [Solirubrobacterales bacterium]